MTAGWLQVPWVREGAAAEFDFAVVGGVDAGGLGGVGDIEDHADVGPEPVGGHLGAVATDFLHDGVDGDERGAGFLFGAAEAGEDFGDDEAAEAVIERAADDDELGVGDGFLIGCAIGQAAGQFGDFDDETLVGAAPLNDEFVAHISRSPVGI